MNAFITGSVAYGTPHKDSDIDLVVLIDEKNIKELQCKDESDLDGYGRWNSIRFGKLNLICMTNKTHFDLWYQGTMELIAKAPVTREQAVEHLVKLGKENGIDDY